MYATILVPIELSHQQSGVNAIKIAKKLLNEDGKIVLVNVVEDFPTYVETQLPLDLLNNLKRTALEELTKVAKGAGIGSHVEIRSGKAATSILEAAKSHDAGLIIIASHQPGLADYFLGSTASRVVRHAHCPVLVDR